jgi:hypothetical protein
MKRMVGFRYIYACSWRDAGTGAAGVARRGVWGCSAAAVSVSMYPVLLDNSR